MWHSVFCASMSGVNTFTPWITPWHKFTPITPFPIVSDVASQGCAAGADTGVVEQQMYLAKNLLEPGAPAVPRHSRFGDVRDHTQHGSARGFQFRFRLCETPSLDVGEHHFHALTNAPFGDPASDAARAAGNHRDFALNSFIFLFPHAGSAAGWGHSVADYHITHYHRDSPSIS